MTQTLTHFNTFSPTKEKYIKTQFDFTNMLDYTSTDCCYVTNSSFTFTYLQLVQNGAYMTTQNSLEPMSLYGSTIIAVQYILFLDGTNCNVLPRPYQNIKPERCRHDITNSTWFTEFLKDVENQVLHFYIYI